MGKLQDILAFIREWQDIKREKNSYCKSCEAYKELLAISNFEKKQLLERLLYVPTKEVVETQPSPSPILPKIIPWKIQRQILEAEDRATAAALRAKNEEMQKAARVASASGGVQAPTAQHMETSSEISIGELEKELGVE